MATLYKEILVNAPFAKVWDALRDFGAVHEKLAPGFVTQCRLEGDTRDLTFFNGNKARELLVGIDENAHRLAYTVVGGRATHHNASAQVIAADENRSRFVWITDVLPNEVAEYIDGMMEQGAAVMKTTLEGR
jgi:carbon monoxide dehydrogenase subunit G